MGVSVFMLGAVGLGWLVRPVSAYLRNADAGRLVELGYTEYLEKRWPTALALLSEAESANPRNAEAHFLRGVIFSRIGRSNDAIEELEAAVQLDSARGEAYTMLARLYEHRGKYDQALSNAMEAVKLDPRRAAAHRALAAAWFGKGRYDKAMEYYERAKQTPEELMFGKVCPTSDC